MTSDGRQREISEIVTYLRAAQVGRVFLGEADGRMTPVFPEMVVDWPRPRIRAERARIRSYLAGEVKKFCRSNFPKLKPLQLAEMYEPLFRHGGYLKLPLLKFHDFARHDLRGSIFQDAPLHSTVLISAHWGLKVEFPEYHLMNDLAFAFNEMRNLDTEVSELEKLSWLEKKEREIEIADKLRRAKAVSRMCLLSCFNLIEAYVNGLAWEYAQVSASELDNLTRDQRKMIEEGSGSVFNRVIEIPRIVSGRASPLQPDQYPFSNSKYGSIRARIRCFWRKNCLFQVRNDLEIARVSPKLFIFRIADIL